MKTKAKWKVEFTKAALKDIKKLDHLIQKRIYNFMNEKISQLENPKTLGESLEGNLKGLWRYKVAKDYRVLCKIQKSHLLILIVEVGHRSSVYTKH